MSAMPEPGSPAPEFDMPASDGKQSKLSDFAGQALVLYFYPKDDTSGCTKQAIAFTEHLEQFDAAGLSILGVSRDSVSKHDKFIDKHGLKIPLASDEHGDVCERYGVWVEKKMYGRTFMGIQRATFLIDGDGTVRHVWPKVKVAGHAEDVLTTAQTIFG